MAEEKELLPCPFCGSRNLSISDELDEDANWVVWCLDCKGGSTFCIHKPDAIKHWNTRAPSVSPQQEAKQGEVCIKCGHNDVVYDGLCAAPIPLIDKEPHGSQRCRCACVLVEAKQGEVERTSDYVRGVLPVGLHNALVAAREGLMRAITPKGILDRQYIQDALKAIERELKLEREGALIPAEVEATRSLKEEVGEMKQKAPSHSTDRVAQDSSVSRSPEAVMRHELENIYMMARMKRAVRHRYPEGFPEVPAEQIGPQSDDPDWDHIIRFCEQAGLRPTILRFATTQPEDDRQATNGESHGPASESKSLSSLKERMIEVVREIRDQWAKESDAAWDERPDLSFEASDKASAAECIASALEAVPEVETHEQ